MDENLELKDGTIWINQDIKKVLQELYDHYRSIQNKNEYVFGFIFNKISKFC